MTAFEEDLPEDESEELREPAIDDYYDRLDWDDLDDSFGRQGFAEERL